MNNIRIIVGTNRIGSNSSKVGNELLKIYSSLKTNAEIIDLSKLPSEIFSPTAYQEKPERWSEFQTRIDSADALVLVVPEYNGSFPGALKYFIDMLEFPKSLVDKPCCFIGISAGRWGGMRAVEQLQDIFIYRGAIIFPKNVLIPNVHECLDANGNITNEEILQRLKNQALSFIDFVNSFSKKD